MVVKASNCSTGPHHLEKQTLPPPIVTQVNFKFGLQLSNIKFVWSSLKETSIFANLAIVKTLSQGKASGIGVRVERGHIIYLNQLYNHFFLPKKRKKKTNIATTINYEEARTVPLSRNHPCINS